jgi:hypothetical protein
MSEIAMFDSTHLAAGGLLLGLILYFVWKRRIRREHLDLARRLEGEAASEQAGRAVHGFRTRTRGPHSWIS